MKTLIIGGNSFVGLRFCKKYKKSIFSSCRTKNSKFYLDLNEINENFFSEIEKEGITHCVFLAAISSPDECENNYTNAHLLNVVSTKEVIKRLLSLSVKVVFFSSDQVYPDNTDLFTSKYPCSPISKYGQMKREVEKAFEYNQNFKIFRLSYIYDSSDGFLNYLKNCASLDEKAEIYKDFSRNIIHIDDVIECMNYAISNWEIIEKISNICGPKCLSRAEIADIIKKKTYNNLKYKVVEANEKFWKARTKICNLDITDTVSILNRAPKSFEHFVENNYEN